jgi:hypothetical protein
MTKPPALCQACTYPLRSDFHKAACLHRYVVAPGGEPTPGATTIAGYGDSGDGLKFGAAKLTAEIATYEHEMRDQLGLDEYCRWLGGEFDRRWKAKANLGTRVHDQALAWSQGKEITALPDEEPYLDALAAFISEQVTEFVACERIVGHPEFGYGGRGDAWGVLVGRGVTCWDYKTGERKYNVLKDALQLTGLTTALGFTVYDHAGALEYYEPTPAVDSLVNVYLHNDGTYALYDTPANDPVLIDAFRRNCAAYHARKLAEKRMKEHAKEAA